MRRVLAPMSQVQTGAEMRLPFVSLRKSARRCDQFLTIFLAMIGAATSTSR